MNFTRRRSPARTGNTSCSCSLDAEAAHPHRKDVELHPSDRRAVMTSRTVQEQAAGNLTVSTVAR